MEVKIRMIGVFILLGFLFLAAGCAVKGDSEGLIAVSPESAVVTLGAQVSFSSSPMDIPVIWSVDEMLGFDEGTINTSGVYTAPSDPDTAPEKVSVRATDPSSGSSGSATAFLTTFRTNVEITTPYLAATARVNTYLPGERSAGQRGIAVYGSNVYVVWADDSQGKNCIFFSKSSNNGENFSSPRRVNPPCLDEQKSPSIAVAKVGNSLIWYVAWEEDKSGTASIYLARDTGNGFGDPVPVSDSLSAHNIIPSVAADSTGRVYVAWERTLSPLRSEITEDITSDIYFDISANSGLTFGVDERFNDDDVIGFSVEQRHPAVAVDLSGNVYVVYEDRRTGPSHIRIRRRVKSGETFFPSEQVDIVTTLSSYINKFPSIVTRSNGEVYVVWQSALVVNNVPSAYNIYVAKSSGGSSFSMPAVVHDADPAGVIGGWAYPAIAADDSYIYVAWDDQRNGTRDIYFAKSSNGDTFKTNRIVNDETGTLQETWHEKPSIAVSGGKAYVIWTDYRNTTGVNSDVFFAREE